MGNRNKARTGKKRLSGIRQPFLREFADGVCKRGIIKKDGKHMDISI